MKGPPPCTPSMLQTVTEQACAKINLTLHVTGQRPDGYHLLDSLVVFASIADTLTATAALETTLAITGPFAASIPATAENLVLRATQLIPTQTHFAFTLHKALPPASGIGGGSADAAAALRAIAEFAPSEAAAQEYLATATEKAGLLGADIPVCIASESARMRGVGEQLCSVKIPPCWITLINPGVAVPTPAVFKALAQKPNPPMPDILPHWENARTLALWLHHQRNDLQPPAIATAPIIAEVLAALAQQPGALIARMSGSGATCFALFDTKARAAAAADQIRTSHPNWWCASGSVLTQRPVPQEIRATT